MGDSIFNFGDILDAVGAKMGPDDPALIHGDRVISWPDMTARSNNVARALHARGAEPGDKAGFYLRNQPEYIEALAACFKGRLTHVNVNYRYLDDELTYIFDNSDAAVVFFDREFREHVERVKDRLPEVKVWVEIGGDGSDTPDYAVAYEDLTQEGDGKPLDIERSDDDLLFLYTGGTTGMPKGVMWSHRIWRESSLESMKTIYGFAPTNMNEHLALVDEMGKLSRQLPACPLMHGTGLFTAMGAMFGGGAIVTLENTKHFDPVELWDTVDRRGVTAMAIVGDAFAKPMLRVLEENPGKYDLSSVQTITSSGVMWSMDVKRGLIEHMPQVALMDSFGASEAVGFGMSVTTAEGVQQTAKFQIGQNCKVFTEDRREVKPGSGEPGFIARGGPGVPLGYYKDPEKTKKTFWEVNGERFAVPGDWCTVEEDGTITLLGRGSNCINSAGEKIYPEEVEEALKNHEAVRDALVVGLPDEKWGQAVTAVVELNDGANVDEDTLKAFVQTQLARYKAPKRIFFKPSLGRAPNGKADYKAIKTYAMEQAGVSA
ncbi:acyl-CoA synthetase [Henriciella aquimarina]|uniref:acyl-CoA synthetase n=1 Tax=Henriciella aquimarina TaxID=545261 RepID=UPI000A04AC73|nr:acyl-CoA synthetase [Henriciella aquimarina]